jgi:type II secretory pathway pseudopilin PulG
MPVKKLKSEQGFTMIMTTIGLSVIAVVALVTVSAVNGDTNNTGRDLQRKRAYEAAKAGINDYSFHLHVDNGYWAKCTKVEAPSAVNQPGSTTNRRQVPGDPGASYAIELLPSNGNPTCNPTSIVTATQTMLESLGSGKGTFRIRSTGFVGKEKVSITATFRPSSFLDYVYFTQLETFDPVTYGSEATIKGAYEQCSKTLAEGRNNAKIPGSSEYCKVISFVSGDSINGPLHTNDSLVICGKPKFGRNASDAVEVSASGKGWYQTSDVSHSGSSCTGTPTFTGTYLTNSPALIPPATNAQLATITEPSFKYKGQVHICLSGNSMKVSKKGAKCESEVLYSGPLPGNGVVYVESELCSGAYTPFEVTYPETSTCGNVYVHGSYSGQLTIATSNDIIIDGNTVASSEEAMLGLIANNFIRIYHPYKTVVINKKTGETECQNGTGSLENIEIDAAILAINHSFIVDNYDCGAQLGTLTVNGAISQKYRGVVGTTNSTGYLKSYNYDDRLHTITPPSFIQPVESDWVIGRETIG